MTEPARTMFRFYLEDVIEEFERATGVKPRTWACPCESCKGAAILFGRNDLALWVTSDLQPEYSIQLIGCETRQDLEDYLVALERRAKDAELDHLVELRAVLRAEFTGRAST